MILMMIYLGNMMMKLNNKPNTFYQFKFKNEIYECIGEDKDFQIIQFRFAIEDKQWTTVKNRISNQLMWGPNIKFVY